MELGKIWSSELVHAEMMVTNLVTLSHQRIFFTLHIILREDVVVAAADGGGGSAVAPHQVPEQVLQTAGCRHTAPCHWSLPGYSCFSLAGRN